FANIAGAQVQHDGRVIGSLVAPCFSTSREVAFFVSESRPGISEDRLRNARGPGPSPFPSPRHAVGETRGSSMSLPGCCDAGTRGGSPCTWRFTSRLLCSAAKDLSNQYS